MSWVTVAAMVQGTLSGGSSSPAPTPQRRSTDPGREPDVRRIESRSNRRTHRDDQSGSTFDAGSVIESAARYEAPSPAPAPSFESGGGGSFAGGGASGDF